MSRTRIHGLALLAVLLAAAVGAHAGVVFTEVMASNNLTLDDFEGSSPDWVELHNLGTGPVDLGGSHLTDDPLLPLKWTFPSPTILAPGGFLVVFCSDKDIAIPGQELHTNFKLNASGDYLALTDAAGVLVDELAPRFPPLAPDMSYGLSFNPSPSGFTGYFMAPTPGGPNGIVGPGISEVTHGPAAPGDQDDIVVEAAVAPSLARSITAATLHYRVQFAGEQTLPMVDTGSGPDAVAGDGIYTALIPRSASTPGQMVRWRVTATESGGGPPARLPVYPSSTDSPQYFGAMIANPGVTSQLPILHWFVQDPSAARTVGGTRCSVWFDGEFYENVFVRRRGNSSSGWPKKNYKFDFNAGNHFRFDPMEGRVEELNLNSTWSDKAFVRRILSWETFEDAGHPGCLARPWRVQQNNQFFSVAIFVEQPDEDLLDRTGLDPRGALYKMFNQLTSSTGGVEKKTRLFEGNGDLQALVGGVQQFGTPLETYLLDNTDVPAIVNYLAATVVIHNNDHVAKNYYLYRDSEGDLEWQFLPWDVDLTFGRNYTLGGGVLNDTMWADTAVQSHPLFGNQAHPKIDNLWNRLIEAWYRLPRLQTMTMRRLRTLMDEQLQPPGTAPALRHFERRIQQLQTLMAPDVTLDQAAWGVPSWGSSSYTFPVAIAQLENGYLAPRRTYLYNTHGPGGTGLIPNAPGVVSISFGVVERDPPSGIQDEEYIQILNNSAEAVDLSGWSIDGGVTFTFPPGTVLPASEHLYVSPKVQTFRARPMSPRGGERNFVIGDYSGHVSPTEGLLLLDDQGTPVDDVDALILCGDCDGNQNVDILDALVGAQNAAGLLSLSDPDFAACNVSGTLGGTAAPGAVVDILDALEIARHAAGLLGALSCTL